MKTSTKFHTLPKEVRADRRRQAFRLLDAGYSTQEVANFSETHISTIYDWINKRDILTKNNYHGLKRGNPNEQKYLNNEQEKEIVEVIKTSIPHDHGVNYHLWSRRAINEFITKKYNISLVPQGISKYTKKWGLSSQRPKKQACEQDSKKITHWLKVDYPNIQKRAKKEGALIHWGDETNVNINTNYQKTYAPIGKTPTVTIPARKISYSMISSLTNQGMLRYMVYKGSMNAKLFKVFLKRLIKDSDKKAFLILDNLKVHHAKIIQKWQKENKDKIEIFFPTTIFSARQP
jgi:transposase